MRTSLKKWICVPSVFIAIIPTHLIRQFFFFLTFSLPSASLNLKVRNDAGSRAHTTNNWENLVLVVVLVLESKALYCLFNPSGLGRAAEIKLIKDATQILLLLLTMGLSNQPTSGFATAELRSFVSFLPILAMNIFSVLTSCLLTG